MKKKKLENDKNKYFFYHYTFDQIALNLERLKFNVIGTYCDKENEKWHKEQGRYYHEKVKSYLDIFNSNL